MGTSSWQNISTCVELIRKLDPQSILDIGVGFGRWGILSREFLEVFKGIPSRKDWKLKIDGIEIFPSCIDKYHKYFYNKIYFGNAYTKIDAISDFYDLVILGDVLEHFEKQTAILLMHKLLNKCKYIILNIPLGENWVQEELYGNPYEKHLSFWEPDELKQLFPIIREYYFCDYIERSFGTFLISSSEIYTHIYNFESNLHSELILLENTKRHLNISKQYLETKTPSTCTDIYDSILNYIDSNNNYMLKILNPGKAKRSLGEEMWILNISTESVPFVNFESVKKYGNWIIKQNNDNFKLTHIISTSSSDFIELKMIGERLCVEFYSHQWSSQAEVYVNNRKLAKINLYSKIPQRFLWKSSQI
jgi:hypothetical protein